MLGDDAKRKLWEKYKARPEAVAEMPSGLFGDKSPIDAEKKVGVRRNKLLGNKQWTADHQAFHDFYYKRLRYDFKGHWEANQDGTKYQKMYAAHEQAMLNDPKKKKLWDAYGSRDVAVAEMPRGLFGKEKNAIPEERTVCNRRSNLLRKPQWTDDHQAFHDFYYKRLKYDFKKEWHAKHNVPLPTE
jgi:hypothetical protein